MLKSHFEDCLLIILEKRELIKKLEKDLQVFQTKLEQTDMYIFDSANYCKLLEDIQDFSEWSV